LLLCFRCSDASCFCLQLFRLLDHALANSFVLDCTNSSVVVLVVVATDAGRVIRLGPAEVSNDICDYNTVVLKIMIIFILLETGKNTLWLYKIYLLHGLIMSQL